MNEDLTDGFDIALKMSFAEQLKIVFKHGVIYSGASILGRLVGFVMLPVYAHYLRGEGYGIIGMIDVFLSVFVVFAGYGISSAMRRIYFQREGEVARKQLISTAMILLFAIVTGMSLFCMLFSDLIAWFAFGKEGMGLVIQLSLQTFIATMTCQNAEVYLQIEKRSILVSFLSLGRLVLGLILNIYFIVYLKMGIYGYLYSGVICGWAATLVVHGLAFARAGFQFNLKDARELLRYVLPLLPGVVANLIGNNVSRVILRSFLGLTMLGAFEMLFKFATLIGVLVTVPFMKIWSIQRLEVADAKEGPDSIARMFTIFLSILIFVGLVFAVEIPILLKLLTPKEFWLPGYIVIIAVTSRILLASSQHLNFGLIYAKKTFEIAKINIIMAVFNIIFSFLLIKLLGLFGAVLQGALSNLITCILVFQRGNPYYQISFEWEKIIKLILLVIPIYLGIDFFSISLVPGMDLYLSHDIVHGLENILRFCQLETVLDWKIVSGLIDNLSDVIDCCFKFVFCFSFLVALILTDILPRKRVAVMLQEKRFFVTMK